MNLDPSDPVVKCAEKAAVLLRGLEPQRVLSNGNLEKQLKFFVALAWEHDSASRVGVMDKSLKFGPGEKQSASGEKQKSESAWVDLLLLEGPSPKYLIETKSTFSDRLYNDDAKHVVEQVRGYWSTLQKQCKPGLEMAIRKIEERHKDHARTFCTGLANCPFYVIHFVNKNIQERETHTEMALPRLLARKFWKGKPRTRGRQPLAEPRDGNLEAFADAYESIRDGANVSVRDVNMVPQTPGDFLLKALVVKIVCY